MLFLPTYCFSFQVYLVKFLFRDSFLYLFTIATLLLTYEYFEQSKTFKCYWLGQIMLDFIYFQSYLVQRELFAYFVGRSYMVHYWLIIGLRLGFILYYLPPIYHIWRTYRLFVVNHFQHNVESCNVDRRTCLSWTEKVQRYVFR